MSDRELLADWYRARGKDAPPVKPEDETTILRNLRARYLECGAASGNEGKK